MLVDFRRMPQFDFLLKNTPLINITKRNGCFREPGKPLKSLVFSGKSLNHISAQLLSLVFADLPEHVQNRYLSESAFHLLRPLEYSFWKPSPGSTTAVIGAVLCKCCTGACLLQWAWWQRSQQNAKLRHFHSGYFR